MQPHKPTRPAAVLRAAHRRPRTPVLRGREVVLWHTLTVPRSAGGRHRLTPEAGGAGRAQAQNPPWPNPRAVPTKAATRPVTMIIRSVRVAEIICAYRPTSRLTM